MPARALADSLGRAPGGEVEVDRNLAGEDDAEVRHRRADAGRQDDADAFFPARSCAAIARG